MGQEELVTTDPTQWYPTWYPYPDYQYWYYPYGYYYWQNPPAIYCPYCGNKLKAHVCGK